MLDVRRLRLERGWNQTELAFHAKLAPSVISQIENGKREPSASTLRKLATALKVEVGDLFPKAASLPFEDAEAVGNPSATRDIAIEDLLGMSRQEFGTYVEGLSSAQLRTLMLGPLRQEREARFAELHRLKGSGVEDPDVYGAAEHIASLYMIAVLQLHVTAKEEEIAAQSAQREAAVAQAEAEAAARELEALAG